MQSVNNVVPEGWAALPDRVERRAGVVHEVVLWLEGPLECSSQCCRGGPVVHRAIYSTCHHVIHLALMCETSWQLRGVVATFSGAQVPLHRDVRCRRITPSHGARHFQYCASASPRRHAAARVACQHGLECHFCSVHARERCHRRLRARVFCHHRTVANQVHSVLTLVVLVCALEGVPEASRRVTHRTFSLSFGELLRVAKSAPSSAQVVPQIRRLWLITCRRFLLRSSVSSQCMEDFGHPPFLMPVQGVAEILNTFVKPVPVCS